MGRSSALATRPDDFVAKTVHGLLLEDRGRRTEALQVFDEVVQAYNTKDPRPEELAYVAGAALHATRLSPNPADDMIQSAARLI